MKRAATFLFASLSAFAAAQSVTIQVKVMSLVQPLDTMKIKAIGSVNTKASPTILQVSPEEATRLSKLVLAQNGDVIGAPSIKAGLGQQASISNIAGDQGVTFTVLPTSKSDMISMTYKLGVIQHMGNHRITRTSSGFARLLQTQRLLIIQNPRDGEKGFIAIIQATRD